MLSVFSLVKAGRLTINNYAMLIPICYFLRKVMMVGACMAKSLVGKGYYARIK